MQHATTGLALEDSVPLPLANLYELLNTLDERSFVKLNRRHEGGDELRSERDVARWLRARGLLVRRETVAPADKRMVLSFRDRLRAVLRSQAAGLDSAALVDDVNVLAGRLPAIPVFDADGAPTLQPAGTAVRRALAQLLADAVTAQHLSLWPRLKMCASEECGWVFYDHSKPRTGRWCSTTVCGNREKRRTYRRRHGR